MKRKLLNSFIMAFAFTMAVIPAEAAEYGVIYDETDQLYTEQLEVLGTDTLVQFTEDYGIDFRVDVLTSLADYDTVESAAIGLYENYEYGTGEEKKGVSLTLLVTEDDDGYAMEDWYVYFGGTNEELIKNAPGSIYGVDAYLSEEAWSGGLDEDALALADAVDTMYRDMVNFVTPVEEEIFTSLDGEETTAKNEASEEQWMLQEAQLDHVTDSVGILSQEQWQALEQQARDISKEHNFEVYAVIVDNYQNYSNGSVQDAAEAIYKRYSLGSGFEKDGLMLLLSMNDRDFSMITHGGNGNYTFNDDGREYMTKYFLDDFAENDWYAGLQDYFLWSGKYLTAAEEGEPYSYSRVPMSDEERNSAIMIRMAIIFLVPLAIAGIYVSVLSAKMKNVAKATKAGGYIAGNLTLNVKKDQFVHATESRTKISSDSNSGGGSSRSSGGGSKGFSGTSGKF